MYAAILPLLSHVVHSIFFRLTGHYHGRLNWTVDQVVIRFRSSVLVYVRGVLISFRGFPLEEARQRCDLVWVFLVCDRLTGFCFGRVYVLGGTRHILFYVVDQLALIEENRSVFGSRDIGLFLQTRRSPSYLTLQQHGGVGKYLVQLFDAGLEADDVLMTGFDLAQSPTRDPSVRVDL